MMFLLGYVHQNQKLELVNPKGEQPVLLDVFSTSMHVGQRMPLDLSESIGKIIALEAQTFDSSSVWGARRVLFDMSAPNEQVMVTKASDNGLFVPHPNTLRISTEALDNNNDVYSAMLESICGVKDDSQPVELYDGNLGVTAQFVASNQSPVCQVQWNDNLGSIYNNPGDVSGVRWGTGTMITENILLTCGHLFDEKADGWTLPKSNITGQTITPSEVARNMKVNFNYQVDSRGRLRDEESFSILELVEYRLGNLDMAICRIDRNPGARFGTANISRNDAVEGDMICIIGHPAGKPKRIEAGPTTAIRDNLILYNDIDTLGGNSGSGILRASDNLLVGIHTNGGCDERSPRGGESNFGQRIEAVIRASPTLQSLLT